MDHLTKFFTSKITQIELELLQLKIKYEAKLKFDKERLHSQSADLYN